MVDDPYAHAVYGFSFFFGVGLARSAAAVSAIARNWKLCVIAAVFGCVAAFYTYLVGAEASPVVIARAATRSMLAWGAILGLLGMAQAHLNRDGPARRYLTEAIFPYYIAHQTIIVVAGFGLKRMSVGPILEFIGIFVAATLGVCADL